MRITENRIVEISAQGVIKNRDRAATTSEALSSGLRVTKPSDDTTNFVEGMRSLLRTDQSKTREFTIAHAAENLLETDRAMTSLQEAIERIRELTTQAANDTFNAGDRQGIAKEVDALRLFAIEVANSRGPDGEFLLAGTNSLTAPFDAAGNFVGNNVTRQIEIGEGQRETVTITGESLTAINGVDIFLELNNLVTALNTNNSAAIRTSIGILDTATNQITTTRTDIGVRVNVLRQADTAREQLEVTLAQTKARSLDIDPVEAASDLALRSAALEGSRAAAERIIALTTKPR